MLNQEHEISIQQNPILYSSISTYTFEQFYEQWYPYVKIRILTLLHYRPDLIDDALQDALVKLWLVYPPKNERNVKGWVWVITQNTVRDTMRKAKYHSFHSSSLEGLLEASWLEEEWNTLLASTHSDPDTFLPERLDLQAIVAQIWAKMNSTDRQVLQDYTNNKLVDRHAMYRARVHFKGMYRTAQKKQARMEALA